MKLVYQYVDVILNMKCYKLLILFMITLKCGADEEPTSVYYSAVQNVTNSDVSNASTTEAPENLFDKWTQLPNIGKSTLINGTDPNAVGPLKKNKIGTLPRELPRQRRRLVTNIIGSLMKGLAQLHEYEDDDEEPTTANYSTVKNVTNSEVFNESTTEAPDNLVDMWTELPNINSSGEAPVVESTRINATDANTVVPFNKNKIGTLPLPRKLPRQRRRLVTNIIGSLMKGLAQLHEYEDDDEEPTTANYSTVENVTNSEVFNESTTEAPDNLVDKWTQLPNINSSGEAPVVKSTRINVTDANAVGHFKKKEFGKLPITRRRGSWLMKNITGSLMKGLAQLIKPDLGLEAEDDDKEPTTVHYSTVENITNSEVSNAGTTEVPKNSSSELPRAESTLINATDANAVSPFKKKELCTLPLPRKLPRHRIRLVTNITGSLMKGQAQLKEPDSEEDDDETTTVNYSTVENVTNSEVYNTSTTETPDNRVDMWTQLSNINSSCDPPGADNNLINVTDANVVAKKKKEFGKLSILVRLPQQRSRIVMNIINGLLKGLSQEMDSNEDTD